MSPSITRAKIPQVFGSLTDVGNVRSHNEDSYCATSPLFVVADGMGGHEAGEVASAIAIQVMKENIPDGPFADVLGTAVKKANLAVLRGAADGTGKPGMGTTMTAALIYEDELVIAQVGDSRAYLLHEGVLQRITRDHSLVADYVAQGRITEEEARYHPQRSVITRALGSDPDMEPDLYSLRVAEGDRLLLCSDGLTSMVEDEGIAAILAAHEDPQRCCTALVQEALAAGGLDNVTAIVVDPLRRSDNEPVQKSSGFSKLAKRKALILWTLAFCLIVAAAIGGFGAYVNNSYFLTAEDGHVSVYRGLPGQLLGINASWLEEKTDVPVSKLAPSTASRLENGGINVDSLEKANELVETYRSVIAQEEAEAKKEAAEKKKAEEAKKDADSKKDAQASTDTKKTNG